MFYTRICLRNILKAFVKYIFRNLPCTAVLPCESIHKTDTSVKAILNIDLDPNYIVLDTLGLFLKYYFWEKNSRRQST